MKVFNAFFFSFLFFFFSSSAQVQLNSVNQAWAYAEKKSTNLQSAASEQVVANYSSKQAKGSLLPSINLNASMTDNLQLQPTLVPANLFNPLAPEGSFIETTFGRRYIYNSSLSVQVDLLNTQKWFSVKSAKLNEELIAMRGNSLRQTLYEQIANAYFGYLLAREIYELSSENVRATAAMLYSANQKFDEGLVSEVLLNTSKINMERAEKNELMAVEQASVSLNGLKLLLNIPASDSVQITDSLGAMLKRDEGDINFQKSPVVEATKISARIAENEWRSSKAAYCPTIAGVYQWNTQVAGDQFLNFKNSNTLPQQFWGLRLSVPVFAGNTKRLQESKARLAYQSQQKQLESISMQWDIEKQNLLRSYTTAVLQLDKSKKILSLYKANDRHSELKFSEGLISLEDRLKTFSDYVNSQNEYLQSVSNYLVQWYRIQIKQINF